MSIINALLNTDEITADALAGLLQIESKAAHDLDNILRDLLKDYRVVITFERKEDSGMS